jgi:prevent-host-death family protein
MKTATVGEIQKNFGRILKQIKAGEEIAVTRRGKPVAKITAIGPKEEIDWPDFHMLVRSLLRAERTGFKWFTWTPVSSLSFISKRNTLGMHPHG